MPSNTFVVLMGLGVVFFGLACIILLTMAMSRICRGLDKGSNAAPPAPGHDETDAEDAEPAAEPAPIQNRQAMIAAISAAVAEELGTDISAIRIRSLKHVGGAAPAAAGRGELLAAVSAAIAEDLGTDISGIRIRSFQQIA